MPAGTNGHYRGRYIILTETFPDHPKIAGLSDAAFRAFVEALCYSRRNKTDGQLSPGQIRKLGYPKPIVRELDNAGLLDQAGPGYTVHDWTDYQTSEARLEQLAKIRSQAGRKGAQVKWQTP